MLSQGHIKSRSEGIGFMACFTAFIIFYMPQMIAAVYATPFLEHHVFGTFLVIVIPKIANLILHDVTIVNKINLIIDWFIKLILLFYIHPVKFYITLIHPSMWNLKQ
jgi:hypothetical protein